MRGSCRRPSPCRPAPPARSKCSTRSRRPAPRRLSAPTTASSCAHLVLSFSLRSTSSPSVASSKPSSICGRSASSSQLGQPALVVDGHRGAVLHRALDVVDADVVAEDRAGVGVGQLDGRAGEADERGVGQRVAHVAREAVDEVVLAAVRLVGDHHDVAPVESVGCRSPFSSGEELLDGGEHHAARGHRSSSRRCARLSACTGGWRSRSWQRAKVAKSWSSRSLRSVMHHQRRVGHRRVQR
jgi:hypothetical protein